MGSLTLPGGGLVYLDANALIYSVERVEPYHTLLDPMWQAAEQGDVTVASSSLTVMEALVKPIRDGNKEIEAQYREIFEASVFQVLDVTLAVFEQAARIRADSQLKTPDSLHAATALHAGCDLFVTNDVEFRRVPRLPTVMLDDLIEEDDRA
ncbi:MAG: type II toxin-antitoxin system VapC family toxin [Chloroflexi bacterium]|nr:type II toxin-antitoxin system VapC family toxin [Chloroflexota bacterium]MCY3587657.1 type II toxin-antitoxin system VapC family toxin [Chloroflexota bacterium]MCY3684556.1 type II toxin-antitoxin system VapC family toxin [Chloroflexota bacterium]MDE2710094.1 type II toxin-antitoxin system VapC family toxin [Chloroflexota bacterium]